MGTKNLFTAFNQRPNNPVWIYPKVDIASKEKLIQEFHIHPVLAQILVSRGLTDVEEVHDYFYAKLPDLHDPFLFSEMKNAVKRINQAIDQNENILIYGDNDVDGMTGCALLTEFIQQIGGNVFYALSKPSLTQRNLLIDSLEYAKRTNCKLIITVDCGITADKEVQRITEEGIDIIITDHHEVTKPVPKCTAILNPKVPYSPYPNRNLTGVGVAFKLAHAITKKRIANGVLSSEAIDLKSFLDLVALGTVADMGILLGENRIFVRYGLEQLKKLKRIGLAELISLCDLSPEDINTYSIASKIAPRLNSLGRIDDPQKGVKLLLIQNKQEAENMALELDLKNIERQKIEKTMSEDVQSLFKDHPEIIENKAIVIHSDNWHPGVIPIICTRISRQYNRPTVIISLENQIGKGSIRSIPEFPILPILNKCQDLLLNYGGHDMAAGMMLEEKNLDIFKKQFIKAANRKLRDFDVITKLHLDADINFSELTFDFMESVKMLEPYGNENPPPILFSDTKQAWPPKILGKVNLKFYLEQNERILEGVGFGMAEQSRKLKRKKGIPLRVAFTPQINYYHNKASIQLMVKDFVIQD